MFLRRAQVDLALGGKSQEEEIMRFAKILLVCLGLVLLVGSQVNGSLGATDVTNRLLGIIIADGTEPPPIPPLTADGTEPPPIPPVTFDGTEPPPIPPLVADGTEPPPIPPVTFDGTEPPPIPPLANGFLA
jgi:hypothetical protein